MGQLYAMKKMIEDLQGQKVTPNDSVVTESLMEGLSYLSNANLTKSKIMKTIQKTNIFHLLCQHKAHQIIRNYIALV